MDKGASDASARARGGFCGSPIIKPQLVAPGAHDAGIEYGVLAPEIAADNMAAHIAERMSVEVTFGQQIHYPMVQWQQPYVSFINELITMLAKSACDISRQQAALPYQDFRSTVRWQGCESIPKSKDSLSMREVVLPISDDNEGAVKGHQVFQVNIVQFQVPHQGVTNLFGAEDIVTTMLENMRPWYEPRNLGVFVAFSATCWGALKVVRQVIGGAPTQLTPHLPSPWFVNGRPSLLEVHHQWRRRTCRSCV